MFPIPDPWRLLPRPSSHGPASKPTSAAEGLLALGGAGMLLALAAGGGVLAYRLYAWLCVPAALLGLGIGMAIVEAPPIFTGIVEAVFYFCVTYVFSGGLDRPDPAWSWVYSGIVAAVFLWAAFSARKSRT